ncbi:MAG TPA: carbohydrate binding family 9 domain-containing protein, partial [Vicinamibacterales bacterium]|nr:carbohydrate binding family 9 domain-containing protein [Vicinamibacterales bacterium]
MPARSHILIPFCLFVMLLILVPALAGAQPALASMPRPAAAGMKADRPPLLDGDVLNDEAWRDVPPVPGDLVQKNPVEGAAASERTEVRILYTSTALYVGVVCFDREPAGIIISDARRDSSLDNTDSFRFILDTYRDGQTGFVFGTNPAGLEYDAQVVNEGQGGGGFAGQQG